MKSSLWQRVAEWAAKDEQPILSDILEKSMYYLSD